VEKQGPGVFQRSSEGPAQKKWPPEGGHPEAISSPDQRE
jgi:hypothetical protein